MIEKVKCSFFQNQCRFSVVEIVLSIECQGWWFTFCCLSNCFPSSKSLTSDDGLSAKQLMECAFKNMQQSA